MRVQQDGHRLIGIGQQKVVIAINQGLNTVVEISRINLGAYLAKCGLHVLQPLGNESKRDAMEYRNTDGGALSALLCAKFIACLID